MSHEQRWDLVFTGSVMGRPAAMGHPDPELTLFKKIPSFTRGDWGARPPTSGESSRAARRRSRLSEKIASKVLHFTSRPCQRSQRPQAAPPTPAIVSPRG